MFTNPVLSDLAALCNYPMRNTSLEVNKSRTIASRSMTDSSDVCNTCLQCGNESTVLEDIIPCSPFQRDLMTTSHDFGCWIFQAVFELEAGSEERVRKTFEVIREQIPVFRTRIVQHVTDLYQVTLRDKIDWHEEITSL